MNQYTVFVLHHFKDIIAEIMDINVVIAGAHALHLHGLILGRLPVDLDLAIYNPTGRQLNALKYWKYFDEIQKRPQGDGPYTEANIRAYKFKKGNYCLDLIIEHQTMVPDDLLCIEYGGVYYKVQSVEGVMEAKRRCFFDRKPGSWGNEEPAPVRFVRQKDILDYIELKNLNFNINVTNASENRSSSDYQHRANIGAEE